MPAGDAEIDRLEKGALVRARREDGKRIMRDRSVMAGTFDGIDRCPMALDEPLRHCQIPLSLLALLQRSSPEAALLLVAAPIGEDDGERDLAFAEIVADGFAHERLLAGIV